MYVAENSKAGCGEVVSLNYRTSIAHYDRVICIFPFAVYFGRRTFPCPFLLDHQMVRHMHKHVTSPDSTALSKGS